MTMHATITDHRGETYAGEVSGRPEAFGMLIAFDGVRLDLTMPARFGAGERVETYRRWTDGHTYADPHSARRQPARVIDHGEAAGYIDRSMFDYPTSATCAPAPDAYPIGQNPDILRESVEALMSEAVEYGLYLDDEPLLSTAAGNYWILPPETATAAQIAGNARRAADAIRAAILDAQKRGAAES
jgi:hypothetical protein